MGSSPSISICLPAYNEGETVYDVAADAYRVAESLTSDFEVLICNDGSLDNTSAELERLQRDFPKVRVLHNKPNRGLAYTFARLYNEASKDFVFLNATDGQWPNTLLAEMYPMTISCDIIASVRRDKHYTPVRHLISITYNLIPFILFGVRTVDAGGVKLIARKFLYRDSLVSRSPFADAERIIRANRDGARISYIPVSIKARETGTSNAIKAQVLCSCLADVFRVFWFLNFR